jgi:hypothetical protein
MVFGGIKRRAILEPSSKTISSVGLRSGFDIASVDVGGLVVEDEDHEGSADIQSFEPDNTFPEA